MGGLLFRIREAGGNLQKPHKGGDLSMIQKLDKFCRRNIRKGGGRQGITRGVHGYIVSYFFFRNVSIRFFYNHL